MFYFLGIFHLKSTFNIIEQKFVQISSYFCFFDLAAMETYLSMLFVQNNYFWTTLENFCLDHCINLL